MVPKTNQYEGMFLLGPAATQENNGGIDLVRGVVERHGGSILTVKKWDERKLAYEIKKQKRGTYILCYFTAPGSALAPIERDVKLSEEILRVMITRADHLNQQEMEAVEPQPIVRTEERWTDDRGGFRDRPSRDDRGPREDRGPRDDRGPREERSPRPSRREEGAPAEAGA